jgi:hypothetical protein
MGNLSSQGDLGLKTLPTRAVVVIVAVACLGLASSAAYDFIRLQSLRAQYLGNIAEGVAADIETQLRAPADRLNPSMWQHLFAESLGARGSNLAFLVLLDESGQALASEGDRFAPAFSGPSGFVHAQGTALYLFDKIVSISRAEIGGEAGKEFGTEHRALPVRLRIGIYASSAAFLRLRAFTHLAIYGAAIAILIVVACLRRTLCALLRK